MQLFIHVCQWLFVLETKSFVLTQCIRWVALFIDVIKSDSNSCGWFSVNNSKFSTIRFQCKGYYRIYR